MKASSFEEEWTRKVAKVRASGFWRHVSSPPAGRIAPDPRDARGNEVNLDASWAVAWEGELAPEGPARIAIDDLRRFLRSRFGVSPRFGRLETQGPRLLFRLGAGAGRWESAFDLRVGRDEIVVRGATEEALLRASLYLSNLWSLRRNLRLPLGRRRVRPRVDLHLGADLWGGFCTTQAWVHGRETDGNFLELARMGINGIPIMALFEDYVLPDPGGPFGSLRNPAAGANRARLAHLARQASRFGVRIFLMAYNPKLAPDHRVFSDRPASRGAIQADGAFRTLCTSDPVTRRFLAESWASLFAEIPDLGGVLAITGGEGFYHCYMRGRNDAEDCPRCSRREGSETVAEFVNAVARAVRAENPEALLLTWPYSAGHWSHDRDQEAFIGRLDPEHVIFQTEVDKDSVDWRKAGYAKNIWDYSMSRTTPSERCRRQRRLCREAGLPFSVKLQVNNSIECLNVPYLPTLENQRAIWENARRLRPRAIHSRWLFDGSCKSPSEEMGFWSIWGDGTEYADLRRALKAIAERDFGVAAAPFVVRAWRRFSEAMRHHPQLDYYVGSYFVGPAQPLALNPEATAKDLDPAFFGRFYWLWETTATDDPDALLRMKPLFYTRPGFRAITRRGARKGQDVALDELREMARIWERGARELDRAASRIPPSSRARFRRELVLGRHLAYTWRSAAHVEEFLRLRDTVREFSRQSWVRSGHVRENLRDLARMRAIATAERGIAREDLALVKGVEFLDLALRLDMGTSSTEAMLKAKIRQLDVLLRTELPRWKDRLLRW